MVQLGARDTDAWLDPPASILSALMFKFDALAAHFVTTLSPDDAVVLASAVQIVVWPTQRKACWLLTLGVALAKSSLIRLSRFQVESLTACAVRCADVDTARWLHEYAQQCDSITTPAMLEDP